MIQANKIYLGDFMKITARFPPECIDLIVTDPPYGVNAWRKGNYEDKEEVIKKKIPEWLERMHFLLKPNCHVYVFIPSKTIENWIVPFKKYFHYNNILGCQTMKPALVYPNKFRNNLQLILFGSKGKPKNFNKVNWILTSDSWFNDSRNKNPERYTHFYPAYIPSYVKATVERRTGCHPDEKNACLVENFIKISSSIGDIVLDGFCGSGVVPAMAKKNRRKFIAVEINREYYEDTIERVKKIKPSSKIVEYFD